MTEKLELLRDSGNVFRDIGVRDADLKHAKALLAAEIIGTLDDENLSVAAFDGCGVVLHKNVLPHPTL